MAQRHYQLPDEYDRKLAEEADRQHRPLSNLAAHYVMAGLDGDLERYERALFKIVDGVHPGSLVHNIASNALMGNQ